VDGNDAETEIARVIEILRSELNNDQPVSTLPKETIESVLALVEFEEELLRFAKYSRARRLVVTQWRSAIIWIAAGVTAIMTLIPASVSEFVWKMWTGE